MGLGGCVDDCVHVLVFTSTVKPDVKANVAIEKELEIAHLDIHANYDQKSSDSSHYFKLCLRMYSMS